MQREGTGRAGWWSHLWPSASQLPKLFWFMCTEPFREGAGRIANCAPVLINSTRTRGASQSQGDPPARMLLSLVTRVHAGPICRMFSIACLFGLPVAPHDCGEGAQPRLKVPARGVLVQQGALRHPHLLRGPLLLLGAPTLLPQD